MLTTPHAEIKRKQRALRDGFPPTMALRVHRAISWIGRAEDCGTDDDARFLFLWIAFNAAYAVERDFQGLPVGERAIFQEYFRKVASLDRQGRIHAAIWQHFSGPIRVLMQNRHVFHPFWLHHNGIPGNEDWPERLDAATASFTLAFQRGDIPRVLQLVFERLYVLRNQLIHGGATWNSRVNRAQVRDGAGILSFLMPVFVDLMMDNPAEDWGQPFYPVIE